MTDETRDKRSSSVPNVLYALWGKSDTAPRYALMGSIKLAGEGVVEALDQVSAVFMFDMVKEFEAHKNDAVWADPVSQFISDREEIERIWQGGARGVVIVVMVKPACQVLAYTRLSEDAVRSQTFKTYLVERRAGDHHRHDGGKWHAH